MPGFDDLRDAPARETLARPLPGREVVQVRTVGLARLAGNVHCVTQQQPAA